MHQILTAALFHSKQKVENADFNMKASTNEQIIKSRLSLPY